MSTVGVYQPRFSVPVAEGPRLKPLDVSSALTALGNALEHVERSDASAWTQKSLTQLEGEANAFIAHDRASGETAGGLTARAGDWYAARLAELRRDAPNNFAGHMLDVGAAELGRRIHDSSMKLEADGRIAERVSDIGKGIANAAQLAYDNPRRAPQLHARSQALLDGTLLPDQTKARLRRQAGGINESALRGTADRDPVGAIGQIDAGAWTDRGIPDEHLAAIRGNAALEQKRRELASAAAATLARTRDAQQARSLAASDVSARLTGRALDPAVQAKIKAALEPAAWSAHRRSSDNAGRVFHAIGDLRTLPAGKIQSALDALKSQPELYRMASANAERIAAEREHDPAAAARDAFPDVQSAWHAYATSGAAGDLQTALGASRAAQTVIGLPRDRRRLLPVDLAENEARAILDAAPDQQLAALRDLRARYGTFAPAALRQIDRFFPRQLRAADAQPSALVGELLWKQAVAAAGPDGLVPDLAALRPTVM